MNILKGIKVSSNTFTYDVIGLNKCYTYNAKTTTWLTTEKTTGTILKEDIIGEKMDLETFQLIARNMHLDEFDKFN